MTIEESATDEAAALGQPPRLVLGAPRTNGRLSEQETLIAEFGRQGREHMDEIRSMITATAARVKSSEALLDSAAVQSRRARQAIERTAGRIFPIAYPLAPDGSAALPTTGSPSEP